MKKCDQTSCNICKPPVLPHDIFSTLHHLPDPVPNGDHYQPFADVYGTITTEKDLPSLKEKESQGHKIPFNPSQQTAKNTGVLVKCSDCSKPRLIHSKHKLKREETVWLEGLMDEMLYSCGSNIQNVDVGDEIVFVNGKEIKARQILDRIFLRLNLVCNTMIELPYYSAGYDKICVHCGDDDSLVTNEGKYPICAKCVRNKKKPKNRRSGKAPKQT